MTIQLPRRSAPAAKTGPRLDMAPTQVREYLDDPSGHGLTKIMQNAPGWEPFVWKGQDLSAWMRTLYIAELDGLLRIDAMNQRQPIAIDRIVAATNEYLGSFGKKPVTEGAILSNLRTASQAITTAIGVSLVPDRTTMTVRLMDEAESVQNLERYFDDIKRKVEAANKVLDNCIVQGYNVAGLISTRSEITTFNTKILAASASSN